MSKTGIAIYIRLSLADEGTGKTKDGSDSIVNQRSLIHGFLDRHPQLSKLPRTEFVDDGYSGTTAERPSFKRMLAQIREGGFSVCVSKDFSRIFRDYIEMGDCLEYLFPSLDVRYISINDGYDSNDYKGTTGGLDVVMRTIVYDAYSKDLSIKESTGKKQSWKKGRRATGLPAYGYRPDPDRKSMDVIDPEAAAVVRRIFDSALAGMKTSGIAKMLNQEDVPTPSAYYRKKNPGTKKYGYASEIQYWTVRTVLQILDRYSYTGASVGNLRKQLRPCGRVTEKTDRSEWIVVPGVHEAIITEEEYETVQKMIHGTEKRKITAGNYTLKSLVVCGNCGRTLAKRTDRFYCQYGYSGGNKACASLRSPKMEDLERMVFSAINDYIKMVDGSKVQRARALAKQRKNAHTNSASREKLMRKIDGMKKRKLEEYERYCDGTVNKGAYLQSKADFDAEIEKYEEQVRALEMSENDLSVRTDAVTSEAEAVCDTFRNEESLTYDMAHAFVDKLVIYEGNRIEIKWRFNDIIKESEVG